MYEGILIYKKWITNFLFIVSSLFVALRRQTSQTSNIEKLLSFNPALHDKISSEADERAIIKDGIKSYVHSARAKKTRFLSILARDLKGSPSLLH